MRVLVTGANGFVGRHLVATLEQGGHSPVLLDLTEAPFRAGLPYYRADLQDAGSLAAIVAEAQPDACVHLAGLAFIPQANVDPALAFRVNTLGTVHVLDALRRHAPAARSLVVTSAQVYGLPVSNAPIPETAPLLPDNLYGVTKIAADHAALLYARTFDVPVMTARPNNHIGPGQSPQFVSSAFAQQLIEIQAGRLEPVMRTGNLASRRDFLDVRDVTRAYLALLEQGRPGEPYNIGTGTLTTIQTLLDELCDLCGVRPVREIDPDRFRPTDDGPVLDITKITTDTGWTPQISLRQTLQDILADVRSTHSRS